MPMKAVIAAGTTKRQRMIMADQFKPSPFGGALLAGAASLSSSDDAAFAFFSLFSFFLSLIEANYSNAPNNECNPGHI
jgi:hypothetical protein